MVVCKCRKATKLYCFVHKVPVCGECICFPEHQTCVIRTYSEWVIDGDYDWPPKCCHCQSVLEEGTDSQTTRLGCLHVMHLNCLSSHIKSFPPHTAPAGYVCPLCSTSIWPPKSIKDSASRLHSKLKEAIIQTGMEKNLFGNHPVSLPVTESHAPPPAFDSDPLVNVNTNGSIVGDGADVSEIGGSTSASNFTKHPSPIPGATTRKGAFHGDRQEIAYHTDDEDGKRKKYSRRGPFRHKFLRALLPFWSSALPTLPVTAPPRKDAEDVSEGRQRQKSSKMDPRKILLIHYSHHSLHDNYGHSILQNCAARSRGSATRNRAAMMISSLDALLTKNQSSFQWQLGEGRYINSFELLIYVIRSNECTSSWS